MGLSNPRLRRPKEKVKLIPVTPAHLTRSLVLNSKGQSRLTATARSNYCREGSLSGTQWNSVEHRRTLGEQHSVEPSSTGVK